MLGRSERGVLVYSSELVYCSVCAPNDLTIEQITEDVNMLNPTGISSRWKLSEDKTFRTGTPYPCACEDDPENRKHYLFAC